MEIITLITIGIALSMDAFSVSLGLGTINSSNKKHLIIAVIVGIMHFLMPILGLLLGEKIIGILHLEAHLLMAAILLLIAFEMIKGAISKEKSTINLNIIGIIAYAFSVSFDSFSAGIGLHAITSHYLLAGLIFALLSAGFTFLGLSIGKFSHKILGIYANIIGAILLIIIATTSFFM